MTGGDKLSDGLGWKETIISTMLKNSFEGYAFTCFIFCVSQHEKNGREGWNTMELA